MADSEVLSFPVQPSTPNRKFNPSVQDRLERSKVHQTPPLSQVMRRLENAERRRKLMSDRKRERARKHFAEAIEKAAQAKENPDKENSSAPMNVCKIEIALEKDSQWESPMKKPAIAHRLENTPRRTPTKATVTGKVENANRRRLQYHEEKVKKCHEHWDLAVLRAEQKKVEAADELDLDF